MKRALLLRLDERGLKLALVAFFLALAVPSVVLIAQAMSQLKWSAFRSAQLAAEEVAARIDATLRVAVDAEDARSFGDYSFLVVEGDAAANFVQRSPLAAFPVASAVPGVLGYFQVDPAGRLTTPLLPNSGVSAATYGIGAEEEAARTTRFSEVREVLARNRLVRGAREEPPVAEEREALRAGPASAPAESSALRRSRDDAAAAFESIAPAAALRESVDVSTAPALQAEFDRLARAPARAAGAGAVPPLAMPAPDAALAVTPVAEAASRSNVASADERQKRVEQVLLPEPAHAVAGLETAAESKLELRVQTFESEVDPFELGVLDTQHFVLFRNAWRDGRRYIQGALVDQAKFLAAIVEDPYRASNVAGVSRLTVALRGTPLVTLTAEPERYGASTQGLAGTLLHRVRLSRPFGDVELAFAVTALPRADGTALLAWVAVTLAVVLCGGFLALYRLGMGQLRLARQQQDFVSAVSHELKTPLTSIRMYGEMLKAGWADDAKKRVYYDYIHQESERLSRLIDNVLELARLTRNKRRFDLKSVQVAEVLGLVRSKVATQVERAGFKLELRNDTPPDACVVADADALAQIFINLVDNALKFSAGAARKSVEIASRRERDGGVLFTVRDFGPGVPKAQMKKIFELFYRPANELTRETSGTGIGLALVRELGLAMDARIDVRNCEPGAELRLRFPAVTIR